jgi:hypothetical protein
VYRVAIPTVRSDGFPEPKAITGPGFLSVGESQHDLAAGAGLDLAGATGRR